MHVPEIAIEGGPGGGKTTAFSYLQSWLLDRGYRVFIIPEVATMLIQGGVPDVGRLAEEDFPRYLEFQREVLGMQETLRRRFHAFAEKFPGPSVILSDRGSMGGKAYLPEGYFEELLMEEGLTLRDVRDSYDAVIHLVTAADGAEAFYTTANNTARRETPEEARALDVKTRNVWVGHPHLRIIDNSTDFEGKKARLKAAVARVLGIPVPLEIERKYLIRSIPNLSTIDGVQGSRIEQIYLTSGPHEQIRIRRRLAQDGSATYYRTVKSETGVAGKRNEREERIKGTEYLSLAKFQEEGTKPILKTRYCFPWRSQYFELDVFKNPAGLILLEIELTEVNDRIELPPFLDVVREVTEEKDFSNHSLSKVA
jgi:CYTH domain-containing protein